MDLSPYSVKDLLVTAIKSEREAKGVYLAFADKVKNYLLRDRLCFLANEEEKHDAIFSAMFKEHFPGEEVVLPERTPVPLPEVAIGDETMPVSALFAQAMEAEKAAYEFYSAMVSRFPERSDIQRMLTYIARMELGHFKILEDEKTSAEDVEAADECWPMAHVGP